MTPGGAPDVRELDALTITKVAVDREMSNNCYLLRCAATGEQVLVDAAAEPERLLAAGRRRRAGAVVTTHQHWDHHRALAAVVAAHRRRGRGRRSRRRRDHRADRRPGRPARCAQGDTVAVGDCTLEVIALAGHTPGSIALLYDDPAGHPHLFTGDSLFPGGVGNTFGDEAAFAQLIDEVETKVFQRLPDETWFYPGHGNDSTLGAERPHLAEWRERGW